MAPTLTASSTEVLAGLVDRVTFHNSDNGFCVLRVKARGQRDLITVLGHAAMISAGEFVQASGSWFNDRTHGVQFRASFLKATAPTTIEGIERYLGSGMIRGRPPKAATSKSAGREPNAPSLGERVLALATGKTRQELYLACPNDRPNHIGISVQRHLRAGRIQERDGKLYATSPAAHAIA